MHPACLQGCNDIAPPAKDQQLVYKHRSSLTSGRFALRLDLKKSRDTAGGGAQAWLEQTAAPSPVHVCVCVCVSYQGKQHVQHFLVDEILGEIEQDVSIVGLQRRAVRVRREVTAGSQHNFLLYLNRKVTWHNCWNEMEKCLSYYLDSESIVRVYFFFFLKQILYEKWSCSLIFRLQVNTKWEEEEVEVEEEEEED